MVAALSGLQLPVRLSLDLHDTGNGVQIRHGTSAEFAGAGRVLDPLWRPAFSRSLGRWSGTSGGFPVLQDRLAQIRKELA